MSIPLSPLAPENLVSQEGSAVLFRVSLIILHTQAESDACYTRNRVSPELTGSRNCVPMAFTAESPPAQGQYRSGQYRSQVSSSSGCFMFGNLEGAVRRGRGGKEKEWTDRVQRTILNTGVWHNGGLGIDGDKG